MIVISIIASVLCSAIRNDACKKRLNSSALRNYFNLFSYGICLVLYGLFLFGEKFSVFTCVLGSVYGVFTALYALCLMVSLAEGPMHITLLITTAASMIIPSSFGSVFGEKFSILKLIATSVLIAFIYLSLDNNGKNKINKKWLFSCISASLLSGGVGILQKIHQTSGHKTETNVFLFAAFVISFLFSRWRIGGKLSKVNIAKKDILLGCVCGVCTYLVNFLNLKLSGMLPSQLFFPLFNGSTIVLNSIISVVVFKEHLTKRQLIGIVGGIDCLILLCIVP